MQRVMSDTQDALWLFLGRLTSDTHPLNEMHGLRPKSFWGKRVPLYCILGRCMYIT